MHQESMEELVEITITDKQAGQAYKPRNNKGNVG